MNLNTGFFPANNHRRKQGTIGYRLSVNNQQIQFSKNIRNTNSNESFLPSIPTNNDGHRPYRRNDFANNHLFIAKKKLAQIFLDQSTMNIETKSNLIHLFDQYQSKQKNTKINKNKQQENNSDTKSTPTLDHDVHLSVVNLIMKPSLPSLQTHGRYSSISHHHRQAINLQTKAPRPSIEWINPAINQHIQSISNHTIEDDLQSNTIINELIDKNSDILNSTIKPLDSSLLYVKSIIPSATSQSR